MTAFRKQSIKSAVAVAIALLASKILRDWHQRPLRWNDAASYLESGLIVIVMWLALDWLRERYANRKQSKSESNLAA